MSTHVLPPLLATVYRLPSTVHHRAALALALIVTLLAGLAAPRAFGQEQTAPVPAPDQAAPAAPAENTTELPAVSRLVYLPQLPTPASLQQEAVAAGTAILRLDRTDDSIVVVYKYADGRTENVGYTILSPDSTQDAPAVAATPSAPAPEITVVSAPPRTVVYREAAPVYYGSRYYYDPFDNFWAPLTLGIGLGYISHGHDSYYRGRGGYSPGRGGFSYGRGGSFSGRGGPGSSRGGRRR